MKEVIQLLLGLDAFWVFLIVMLLVFEKIVASILVILTKNISKSKAEVLIKIFSSNINVTLNK